MIQTTKNITGKDTLEHIDGSLVQHGKLSDRIYLMKLAGDPETLVARLDTLAAEAQYSKIFAKVPAPYRGVFEAAGYRAEAHIPGFFEGTTDVVFMAKFPDPSRADERQPDRVKQVIEVAVSKEPAGALPPLSDEFHLFEPGPEHAEGICEVYRKVFETYPFPIHDPVYIRSTMDENFVYFAITHNDRIVSMASSEMDENGRNVEMTDFATIPDYRGHGHALYLLKDMENAMSERGILTGFTIARAVSFGMNATFAKAGYAYTGTLVNNTNICGRLESMNVWYKPLG